MLIRLHDDEGTYIKINECPYRFTWTFETYIVDFFAHYRNQMPPLPIVEWPLWVKESIAHLSHIVNMDAEEERHKNATPFKP